MLALSRSLIPECRHLEGDMRTVRVGEAFDGVFVHDAIAYITSEDDLAATIATVRAHLPPGRRCAVRPRSRRRALRAANLGTEATTATDGRALRYVEWIWDPDPDDTTYVGDFAYLLRDEGGTVRCVQDRHVCGLFPRATWLAPIEYRGLRGHDARRARQARVADRGLRRPRLEFPAMRRYHVTTFGCQMNAHDSERIKGMLEELGLGEAATKDEADVLVFNTCTIREKPDSASQRTSAGARRSRSATRDA